MVRRLRWTSVEDFLAGRVRVLGECWVWTGSKNEHGYGTLTTGGRHRKAHRFVMELASGEPIPPGLRVLHACDNPPCVRPDHLRLGTQRENLREAKQRGRLSPPPIHCGDAHHARRTPGVLARGEAVGTSKLSAAEVREIRSEAARGEAGVSLAKRFGVTAANVSLIVRRKAWRHVA